MLSVRNEAAHTDSVEGLTRRTLLCPKNKKQTLKDVLTTAAVDNPSSITANGSFHGASVSSARHGQTESEGEKRMLPESADLYKRKEIWCTTAC